jgi:hypothetical protein
LRRGRTDWRWAFVPIGVALAARLVVFFHYGPTLNIHSDDMGYMGSAIRLLQLGRLTYHTPNEHTVHMMPGISLLLAAVFAVFGWHTAGMAVAKLVMIACGCVAVYFTYRLGAECWAPWAGFLAAMMAALYPPAWLTDNLLLTEAPFEAALMALLYFSWRLARERRWSQLAAVVSAYLAALLFRPTIALYPAVLALYFLTRKYPLGQFLRHAGVAAGVVCTALLPWWIRNYHWYHAFIPLTGGQGDPLLLGTYQGVGFPPEPSYAQVLHTIYAQHPGASAYEVMQLEAQAAHHRMAVWWSTARSDMIRSYLWLKPQILWQDVFWWIPLFGWPKWLLASIQWWLVRSGLAGWTVTLVLGRGTRREALWMLLTFLYFTLLYAYYFVYGRYSEPLTPVVWLGIAAGLHSLWRLIRAGLA